MGKRRKKTQGKQKGPQQHAEGAHGEKTHKRIQEILRSGPSVATPDGPTEPAHVGDTRLFEGREQHDEAEKNSEKTRLSRDIDRHGHIREEFQVVGGKENHPKA